MIKEEIQIVKRRLDDYQSYSVLALEADRNALGTAVRMTEAGQPKSPSWGKVAPSENHLDLSSIYNQLLSDQMYYEKESKRWHTKMDAIEDYIMNNYSGDVQLVMRLHYLEGQTYEDLEDTSCLSADGLKKAVHRAMEKSDFRAARLIL